jgi:hypothetical protein
LVEKPEGNRPLGRTRYRWKDTIKWIFEKQNAWYVLDSSGLGEGPVVGSSEYGNDYLGSVKCREYLE